MMRVEIDVSIPSSGGKPADSLELARLLVESLREGLPSGGAVVHRFTVEEADA